MGAEWLKDAVIVIGVAAATVLGVSWWVNKGDPAPLPVTAQAEDRPPIITLDPGIVRAWENALRKNDLDPAHYMAVYMHDPRTHVATLLPRDDAPPGLARYKVTIERGSFRVLGFTVTP